MFLVFGACGIDETLDPDAAAAENEEVSRVKIEKEWDGQQLILQHRANSDNKLLGDLLGVASSRSPAIQGASVKRGAVSESEAL